MVLRILLLDDNPDDRILARRELERHFSDCAITEVGDRYGFECAVADDLPFDLVITDYQMRWTTGLDVLKYVKAHAPQLPVIMFTATGTQETAVEAMKHGLDDYVIKSPRHYARLPIAVGSCLDRAEIRARAIRTETRLAALLENIHLGVFRMSLDGELEEGNRAFWAMLDMAPGDSAGLEAQPLIREVRRHLPRLDTTLATAELQVLGDLSQGGRARTVKLVRVRVNGHDAVDGIVEDVTSLRQANQEILRLNAGLEQRIAERTRQLQEANEALETFGFSVSHDLREPLRTIQGYANALKEDYQEGRQDKFSVYITRIEAVTRRVDAMVSDLLEFARLSRTEIAIEAVPVVDAVREMQMMSQSEPGYGRARIDVDVPPDIFVKAHRQTFVQILTNLVSNAVKFVRPERVPEVRVRAVREGARVRISVEDNGVGIAAQAQGRIFNVFERLHSEEEFPGTGIGLAIVKKGLERMGGGVRVVSAPDAGSTFLVDLPAA
jgi:signal transduction histidine kinase